MKKIFRNYIVFIVFLFASIGICKNNLFCAESSLKVGSDPIFVREFKFPECFGCGIYVKTFKENIFCGFDNGGFVLVNMNSGETISTPGFPKGFRMNLSEKEKIELSRGLTFLGNPISGIGSCSISYGGGFGAFSSYYCDKVKLFSIESILSSEPKEEFIIHDSSHSYDVSSQISDDGNFLAIWSRPNERSNEIKISLWEKVSGYDLVSWKKRGEFVYGSIYKGPIDVSFGATEICNIMVTANEDGKIRVYDIDKCEILVDLELEEVNSVVANKNGFIVGKSGSIKEVKVWKWDLATSSFILDKDFKEPASSICKSLAIDRNGMLFASGMENGIVRLYSLSNGVEPITELKVARIEEGEESNPFRDSIKSISIECNENKTFLSALTPDEIVKVWDISEFTR